MNRLWLLAAALTFVQAWDTDPFAGWPPCGVNCVDQSLPSTNCNNTEIACICAHPLLMQNASLCAEQTCSSTDLLATKHYSAAACGIAPKDRSKSFVIIISTMCGIALIMVITRLVSRQMGSQSLTGGWYDALVIVSWCLAFPLSVTAGFLADTGIGKDIWDFPLERLTQFLLLIYVESLFYMVATGTVKIALLVFYLRVFPGRTFRHVAFGVIALCYTSTITFTIACALQCLPISYNWEQGNGQATGTCVNLHALAFTQAAANITLDVLILALPMPILYKLHVNWRKKLQITVMFSFGIIIVLVGILRLRIFVRDFDTDNPTSDFWAVLIWDAAEAFTSITCVRLPAAKCFFHRGFTWSMGIIRQRWPETFWPLRRQRDPRSSDLLNSTRRPNDRAEKGNLHLFRRHKKGVRVYPLRRVPFAPRTPIHPKSVQLLHV